MSNEEWQEFIKVAGKAVLAELSTTQAKTQRQLIEALEKQMNYGILLFALRDLYDEGQMDWEQMNNGHFKWLKKEEVDG